MREGWGGLGTVRKSFYSVIWCQIGNQHPFSTPICVLELATNEGSTVLLAQRGRGHPVVKRLSAVLSRAWMCRCWLAGWSMSDNYWS